VPYITLLKFFFMLEFFFKLELFFLSSINISDASSDNSLTLPGLGFFKNSKLGRGA